MDPGSEAGKTSNTADMTRIRGTVYLSRGNLGGQISCSGERRFNRSGETSILSHW